jgi:hypothetical protein
VHVHLHAMIEKRAVAKPRFEIDFVRAHTCITKCKQYAGWRAQVSSFAGKILA